MFKDMFNSIVYHAADIVLYLFDLKQDDSIVSIDEGKINNYVIRINNYLNNISVIQNIDHIPTGLNN